MTIFFFFGIYLCAFTIMAEYFKKFNEEIEKYVDSVQEKRNKFNNDIFHIIIDTLSGLVPADRGPAVTLSGVSSGIRDSVTLSGLVSADSGAAKSADKYFIGGIPVANFYKFGLDGMKKNDGWIFYTPSPVHIGKKLLDVLCRRDSRAHISRKSFTIYELSYPYVIDGAEFTFTVFLEHIPDRFFDTYSCFIDAEILGKKISLATPDMIMAWTYFMFAQPGVAGSWSQIYSINCDAWTPTRHDGLNVAESTMRAKTAGSMKNAAISYVAPSSVRTEKNDTVIVFGEFVAILRPGKTDCSFGTRTTFKKNINGVETTIPMYYIFGEFLSKSPATLLWLLYMEKMVKNTKMSATVNDKIIAGTSIFANTTVAEMLNAECKTSLFDLYRTLKWYDPIKYQREISCP